MQETKQNKPRFGSMADAFATAGIVKFNQDGHYETTQTIRRKKTTSRHPNYVENEKGGLRYKSKKKEDSAQ